MPSLSFIISMLLAIAASGLALPLCAQESTQSKQPEARSVSNWVFISKPTKCVGLKQGKVCYQKIKIVWHAPKIADYCLYQSGIDEPLKCWQRQSQGQLRFKFAEKQSQTYSMRQAQTSKILASTKVEVKWVYKSRRREFGWRVF